jgi:hypothetical protein
VRYIVAKTAVRAVDDVAVQHEVALGDGRRRTSRT